jgi:purine-binding chemotaxis protein CheW
MRQYLTFVLGTDVYAVGILAVKEIIEYPDLIEVPMLPVYIRGVINLRGAVVPVIDPAVRFGRPLLRRARRSCVVIIEVILEGQPQVAGIMVDGVDSVLEIPDSDIEPPPSCAGRIRVDFIQGMAKINGRLVILLDAQQLLAGSVPEAAGNEAHAALV